MLDEVNVGAAAGDSGGSGAGGASAGSSTASGSASGTSGASSAAPSAPLSDDQLLESIADKPSGAAPDAAAPAKAASEKAAPEINLDALADGQPEWLAKVTDPAAKAEIEKLLGFQKQFADWFKDDADRDTFLKALPGGREQITALQTLSQEVTEMDANILANTPEGNLAVASRYLGEAPDKGVGLFRAGAQHLAKTNPEAWKQVGSELLDSTLAASGLGINGNELLATLAEMKQALAMDEEKGGQALGAALGKLFKEPGKAAQADPEAARIQEERETSRQEVAAAKTEIWNVHVGRVHTDATNHMRQMIGQALAVKVNGKPLISDAISADSRGRLTQAIYEDIDRQLMADPWYVSQVKQLIGDPKSPLLSASKDDFAKAFEITKARVGKLLAPATIKKHVETWARDVVAKSNGALERARGAAASGDKVGAAPAVGSGGRVRPLTQEALAKMSPEERDDAILAQVTR